MHFNMFNAKEFSETEPFMRLSNTDFKNYNFKNT